MKPGGRAQDRLARLLGASVDGRAALVQKMLRRDSSESTSYWLQLLVSVGIATLGLVVGSAAVVIGAMLIAPLMGPIIGLAMGLATGSPYLVLRSAGRLVLSMLAAVGGAALITLLLPFHESNAEIVARTSPTVLDLITASFCALAGVYAALRPSTDTAATAAGTSIGISLVPPLCASGYGVGTGAWAIAGGAALLFLTNTVAIVVVGSMSFLATGFNQVDVLALEKRELEGEGEAVISRAVARRLSGVFASRFGVILRFLMPVVLLGVVYVPLRRALNEVAWEVRVRASVRDALAKESLPIVQSRVRIERHEIDVVLVLLGTPSDAEAVRSHLDAEIRQAAGVVPRLQVVAVADADHVEPIVPVDGTIAPLSPEQQLTMAQSRISAEVEASWPATRAGAPLVIDVSTATDGPLTVRVVHLGPALSADAIESVARGVSGALRRPVVLNDVALPSELLTREGGDLAFVARAAAAARASSAADPVTVCVVAPALDDDGGPGDHELAKALDDALSIHPRVVRSTGTPWSVRFVVGSCPLATPPAVDAGAPDASVDARVE